MEKHSFTLANGEVVYCYGQPTIGANYELTYDNEYKDTIATDITATSWKGVLAVIQDKEDLVQIIAC